VVAAVAVVAAGTIGVAAVVIAATAGEPHARDAGAPFAPDGSNGASRQRKGHSMNPGVNKRQKERQRQERQKEKAERKKLRQEEKRTREPTPDGVDPDIAGIVPGPQPPADEEA
jgi:hypothetical protein